jgi:DeoR/GlpR family transcriptional regulator of sugar metabolism
LNHTVLINSGTTTLEVVRALRHQRDLSVVTNNVQSLERSHPARSGTAT